MSSHANPIIYEYIDEVISAARSGEENAQFILGYLYNIGNDKLGIVKNKDEAINWFKLSADNGFPFAQYALGDAYTWGDGVYKDRREGYKWYLLAANQGLAVAQSCVGELYRLGYGIPQNFTEAKKWYRSAAEQDDAIAQHYLATLLWGESLKSKNYIETYMWFNIAASQESEIKSESIKNRNIIAQSISNSDINKAQQLGLEWKPKLSQNTILYNEYIERYINILKYKK